MFRTRMLILTGVLFLLACGLAACSALSAPRQIAAYPRTTPFPQSIPVQTYDLYLELEVADVDDAEDRVTRLVYGAGGLVEDSTSWQQAGYRRATLVLAMPVDRAEAAREALFDIGTPLQGQLSSRITDWRGEGAGAYAYFTVQLVERGARLTEFSPGGWRPVHTLAKAWSVFSSIFGFLLDILIWMAVVFGPFVLIGAGLWAILRHCRSRRVNKM